MTTATLSLLVVFIVAILTTSGGLWIASRKPSWYNSTRLSMFVAIGAGLLLGVAFMEFLPLFSQGGHPDAPILLVAGILTMVVIERYVTPRLNFLDGPDCGHEHAKDHDHKSNSEHEHAHHLISHQAACSAIGCLIVCAFFDGFEIRSAFMVNAATGWVTSFGLFFHILPDGVLAASIALAGGLSKKQAKLVATLTGAFLIAGALSATLLSHWISFAALLPFATGVLIYVIFIHLFPVGLKHPNGVLWLLVGALFFAGAHRFAPEHHSGPQHHEHEH